MPPTEVKTASKREQSGFTNRTTFARLFAAYYSMTPSEYRKIAHK